MYVYKHLQLVIFVPFHGITLAAGIDVPMDHCNRITSSVPMYTSASGLLRFDIIYKSMNKVRYSLVYVPHHLHYI